MSKGFFTDKKSKPTEKGMRNIIGGAINNWDVIYRHLTTRLNLRGDLKFYGVSFGWALCFCKSGKAVVALYPARNCFTVQIILNKGQEEVALAEVIDMEIVDVIRKKEAVHEGNWICIRVDRETGCQDILKLVDIRFRENKDSLANRPMADLTV